MGWIGRRAWRIAILCAGPAFANLVQAGSAPRTWQFGAVTLHPCELAQAGSAATVAAWCGRFAVPVIGAGNAPNLIPP